MALEAFRSHLTLEKGQDLYLRQVGDLKEEQVGLFSAFWCRAEVCNGGFYQFFVNSTGIVGPEAILGFNMLDLNPTAGVVLEAMILLGPNYPRDWKSRTAVLKKIHKLEDLRAERSPFEIQDRKFYDSARISEFPAVADDFVRKHMDRFFIS